VTPATALQLPAEHEVAVVRLPIADARRSVVGYELFFGDESGHGRNAALNARATSAMLVDAFADLGLDRLVGGVPAWISVARDWLVEVGMPPVRPDRAVLQIAAYPCRDDLLAVLQRLSRSGFTLALADYDGRPDLVELMALCSIVKVDVSARSGAHLRAVLAEPARSGALLVATGVDSNEDFERCREAGFTYFEGRFLSEPVQVRGRGVATSGLGSLRRMQELTAGDVSFEDLERIIGSDVGLSLKLLRYVNSAFFALPRDIGSVREAMNLLGVRPVRRWATIIAMSAIPDVSNDLLNVALQRAHMCELLSAGEAAAERESAFTVGLFSVADALMGSSMEELLEELPFADDVRDALLARQGRKGELLAAVEAYEQGEFPALPSTTGETPTLASAYRQALEWAEATNRAIA
jgi:EAL and modified HD-GYP domain-containing signal transduction protein